MRVFPSLAGELLLKLLERISISLVKEFAEFSRLFIVAEAQAHDPEPGTAGARILETCGDER